MTLLLLLKSFTLWAILQVNIFTEAYVTNKMKYCTLINYISSLITHLSSFLFFLVSRLISSADGSSLGPSYSQLLSPFCLHSLCVGVLKITL